MENKETQKIDAENAEMEMEELNMDDIEQVAGGVGLRNRQKVKTADIDDNTISRI